MALHVFIHGIVQGVGFRAWIEGQAASRGIHGWARNLRDGRIEAWIEGDEDILNAFIKDAHQGPPFADVSKVTTDLQPNEGFESFEVRPTGSVEPVDS